MTNSIKDFLARYTAGERNFEYINLQGADLHGADLHGANLHGANLRDVNLRSADLHGADLFGANLRLANLQDANLQGADLQGANLQGADLQGADLRSAYLQDAKNIPVLAAAKLFVPPQKGEFIAYKKVQGPDLFLVAELLIPADAERSSATSRKCRASRAITQAFFGLDGTPLSIEEVLHCSQHGPATLYEIGETTYPDKWDPDRWKECSHGIHFFMTFEEAAAW